MASRQPRHRNLPNTLLTKQINVLNQLITPPHTRKTSVDRQPTPNSSLDSRSSQRPHEILFSRFNITFLHVEEIDLPEKRVCF